MRVKLILFIMLLICNFSFSDQRDKIEKALEEQISTLTTKHKSELLNSYLTVKGDIFFIGTTKINNVLLSNLIISKELIADPLDRYYIAHYIRNLLLKDIKIFENSKIEDYKTDKVEVDDKFIIKNKDKICMVVYYLMHKNYFNFYEKDGNGAEKIFVVDSIIKVELNKVKMRLVAEKAIVLTEYMYP